MSKTLIEHADILTHESEIKNGYFAYEGNTITYIGQDRPEGAFDRIIDGTNRLLIPGLYNLHTHTPMTLFRGYAEELPLDRWLNEKIFPAEDKLFGEAVYYGTLLSAAEMIAGGVVSASDMYFFCDDIVRAFADSGMKANVSRAVTCFDPNQDMSQEKRLLESVALFEQYDHSADGRILVDLSIHAEYTNVPCSVQAVAQKAKELNTGIHVHLSETQKEHEECIRRHGLTPTAYMAKHGVFDVPVTAAHCVWIDQNDRKIFAETGATAVHNPTSNLKLASGIADVPAMLQSGIRVALGTDGAASNNNQNLFEEMHLAAILHKGYQQDPLLVPAKSVLEMATVNGARAQRREHCGELKVGCRADFALLNCDKPHLYPRFDSLYALLYSAQASDVCMTVVDGKTLYENGTFTTIDIQRVQAKVVEMVERMKLDF